jgi:hypothetical protein
MTSSLTASVRVLRYMRDGGWISIDAPPRDDYDEDDIYDADEYNARAR